MKAEPPYRMAAVNLDIPGRDGCLKSYGWKDGCTQNIPLKDMKESYPVEIADYAKDQGIVLYMLWKRYVIISAVKTSNT